MLDFLQAWVDMIMCCICTHRHKVNHYPGRLTVLVTAGLSCVKLLIFNSLLVMHKGSMQCFCGLPGTQDSAHTSHMPPYCRSACIDKIPA